MTRTPGQVSRVTRPKHIARASYDRMSRWYDLIAGRSEWKYVKVGLDLLNAGRGERVLEIGYGTGKAIVALAHAVGRDGRVDGIDLSAGMYEIASQRVRKEDVSGWVDLQCGDAVELPYKDSTCDAIFSSFTLELFDTPEIPIVLQECYRVLRGGGRIAIVSMSKKTEESLAVKVYDWAHSKIPNYVDCRPIYVREALTGAGFLVGECIEMKMWGLPVDAVLGRKASPL